MGLSETVASLLPSSYKRVSLVVIVRLSEHLLF